MRQVNRVQNQKSYYQITYRVPKVAFVILDLAYRIFLVKDLGLLSPSDGPFSRGSTARFVYFIYGAFFLYYIGLIFIAAVVFNSFMEAFSEFNGESASFVKISN